MAGVTPVELRGDGLLLRPYVLGDVPAVVAACQDVQIQRWTYVPVPYRPSDAEEFVASCPHRWGAGSPTFAVVDPASAALVGSIDLHDAAAAAGPMVGYWVAPEARGHGVAARAVRALCSWGFASLALGRIQWSAEVGNVASRRVAETCGFTIEGTLRRGLVGRDGVTDGWIGSLLPDEPMRRAVARLVPYEPRVVRGNEGSLQLRAPTAQDVPWVLEAYQDSEIGQWNPADVTDRASAEQWVAGRADWTDGDHASWLVAHRDTGQAVGSVSLHRVDSKNLTASIGYWIHPDHRGNGYASGAVRLASNWGLSRLGLRRIELIHAVDNAASCGVADRAGFELEGTLRQGERYGDGRWHDEHVHSRCRTDSD